MSSFVVKVLNSIVLYLCGKQQNWTESTVDLSIYKIKACFYQVVLRIHSKYTDSHIICYA